MLLTQSVYSYFMANLHRLDDTKRFHFATRIAAWSGATESYRQLQASRSYIAPQSLQYKDLLRSLYSTIPTGQGNAHGLRVPYFNKYPTLYGTDLVLFRVRHLKEVYGIDVRNELFSIISKQKLIELRDSLLSDTEALKFLSTYAISSCYLINKVILDTTEPLPLTTFLGIGKTYDTANPEHIKLLIYLYTHCIIGESNFYTKLIPLTTLPLYTEMLYYLERLIEDNFQKINLDNKLEFLVCARICNFDTGLFDKIYTECEKSVSTEGTFLIDTCNDSARLNKSDFLFSEHRNVLFIMSGEPYAPHSTLVT